MSVDSEIVNDFPKIALECFENDKTILMRKIAAEWFKKELNLLTKKSQASGNSPESLLSIKTFIDWVLGDYSSKWHDAVTHRIILAEIETRPEVQRFIGTRLPILASSHPFFNRPTGKDKMEIYDIVSKANIFPLNNYETNSKFLNAVSATTKPNYSYLQEFFFQNHWLLVLFFCLTSFQFFGYDQELIGNN